MGALPDAAMIVVSGLGGTRAEAQEQLAVGIGTLAGSTVIMRVGTRTPMHEHINLSSRYMYQFTYTHEYIRT